MRGGFFTKFATLAYGPAVATGSQLMAEREKKKKKKNLCALHKNLQS